VPETGEQWDIQKSAKGTIFKTHAAIALKQRPLT
jgi:hypothetical protein